MPPDAPALPASLPASEHLVSIEALRGFDMFWIVGAEDIVHGLGKVSDAGVAVFLVSQLKHKEWESFGFYDLIFPLFVFLVGTSIVPSLGRLVE